MDSIFRTDLLRGRRALVTGGGSGICRGIALALAGHGAKVAVSGRRPEPLQAVVAQFAEHGAEGMACPMDVRKPQEVQDTIDKVVERFGGLDLVINGAAGNFLCPAAQLSPNGFRTVVDIDLCGSFHLVRAAFAALQASGGSIINISATLHYGGTPMQLHVAAAKAGIDAMTRNLAVEWGPLGIRVNAIAPGPIDDTEGMARLAPGPMRDKMARDVPLGRLGKIDDIAQAALFLASDGSAYINGAVMVVDGGRWLNNMPFQM